MTTPLTLSALFKHTYQGHSDWADYDFDASDGESTKVAPEDLNGGWWYRARGIPRPSLPVSSSPSRTPCSSPLRFSSPSDDQRPLLEPDLRNDDSKPQMCTKTLQCPVLSNTQPNSEKKRKYQLSTDEGEKAVEGVQQPRKRRRITASGDAGLQAGYSHATGPNTSSTKTLAKQSPVHRTDIAHKSSGEAKVSVVKNVAGYESRSGRLGTIYIKSARQIEVRRSTRLRGKLKYE